MYNLIQCSPPVPELSQNDEKSLSVRRILRYSLLDTINLSQHLSGPVTETPPSGIIIILIIMIIILKNGKKEREGEHRKDIYH